MTTHCTPNKYHFSTPHGDNSKPVEADFSGGAITSNSGLLLAGKAEQSLDLLSRLAQCFDDIRQQDLVVHQLDSMLGQYIFGLIAGYEDVCDHDELRKDSAFQAALGHFMPRRSDCEPLAGKSTLNRLLLGGDGANADKARKVTPNFDRIDQLLVDLLVESYDREPEQIVVDVDATDFVLHGDQEKRFYHGYVREYCYMPVMMFVGRHPVLVRLRTASYGPAVGIEDELTVLVARLRERWPNTQIIIRTDSGYCNDVIMSRCEDIGVDYVFGLAKNDRLKAESAEAMAEAVAETEATGEASRRFCEFQYKTRTTWRQQRRVIGKAEALPSSGPGGNNARKENHRYIVTTLDEKSHPAQSLYEDFYCARGDAENRLRELKRDLFAERCSSSLFNANALRLCLTAFAHILYNRIRQAASDTELARATVATLCRRLIKIGAQVKQSCRRIHFAMSASCPDKDAYATIWHALDSP